MLPIMRNAVKDLWQLQSGINSVFNDFWGDEFPTRFSKEGENMLNWSPRADIEETNDAFVLHADLPGVQKNDVKITMKENVLTISGERKYQDEKKKKNFHRMERSYGGFQRSFALPTTVKSNDIKAEFKDGVLSVTLPKADEVKPKEIAIQ